MGAHGCDRSGSRAGRRARRVDAARPEWPAVNEAPKSNPSDDPRIGSVLGGRYRIVRVLGAGGMGVVYRGEHVHMHKPVAIKVLHKHMTAVPEIVARFEREAVAAGRIQHPHVAAATDFGKLDDGSFYLALEYVEGKSLGSLIAGGALPVVRALLIARQIAEGLDAAHAAGIVHRDLKPDNVQLLSREGYDDWVKILDFGIAKVQLGDGAGAQPLTQLGTVFGTPEYMSPEQAQGHSVDARSDLYALGVMLFEMLTGKIPFDANDVVVLIMRHVTQPPPPLPSSIPGSVQRLVEDLLAKKPEDRVPSAAELVRRIERLLEDPGVAPKGSIPPGANSRPPASGTASTLAPHGTGAVAKAVARVSAVVRTVSRRTARSTRELGRRLSPELVRPVRLGPLMAPLGAWLLGAAGLMLLGVLIALLVFRRGAAPAVVASGTGTGTPAVAASGRAGISEQERHQKLLLRAEAGDETAIAEVEALPEKRVEESLAVARGRCARGEMVPCVSAYKAAVMRFTRLRSDRAILPDVRRAAEHPIAYEEAMRLAAHQLGEGGVDVLWDVWIDTKKGVEKSAINRRARAFLDDGSVRRHASDALGVVLELERAEKRRRCKDAERALASVVKHGDERVLPVLERFAQTRGCGLLDLGDCWPCLRGSTALSVARDTAKARPAPAF
jgi:serine/threonine protein kinase